MLFEVLLSMTLCRLSPLILRASTGRYELTIVLLLKRGDLDEDSVDSARAARPPPPLLILLFFTSQQRPSRPPRLCVSICVSVKTETSRRQMISSLSQRRTVDYPLSLQSGIPWERNENVCFPSRALSPPSVCLSLSPPSHVSPRRPL